MFFISQHETLLKLAALVFLSGATSGFALHVPLYTIGLQPSRRRQKSSVFHGVLMQNANAENFLITHVLSS